MEPGSVGPEHLADPDGAGVDRQCLSIVNVPAFLQACDGRLEGIAFLQVNKFPFDTGIVAVVELCVGIADTCRDESRFDGQYLRILGQRAVDPATPAIDIGKLQPDVGVVG